MTRANPIPRKHRRFAIDVEATLGTGASRTRARTRDISRDGICVIAHQELQPGTVTPVELVLAFGDDHYSEPLQLNARVVWCTRLGEAFQVGAMFDDVTDQQDGFLVMFLEYLRDGAVHHGSGEDDEKTL